MNLFFMRHGEATDNVKELISDKEIYWSVLTENGKQAVKEAVELLPNNIDIMYVSPLPRTIETAHYVFEKYPTIDLIIENRIREIYYGKYSHQKNNEELDETRRKQIAGDYFVRFGSHGENKYDIEVRLCDFLKDVYNNNDKQGNVLIVSHGSIISYMKRVLELKTVHIKKGQIERFDNVNFDKLFEHIELLNNLVK